MQEERVTILVDLTVALFVVLECAVFSVGCSRTLPVPEYPNRLDIPIEKALGTPRLAVVVAQIRGCAVIGGEHPSRWGTHAPVQLFQLDVRIENVLQGDLTPGGTFLYYDLDPMAQSPNRTSFSAVNECGGWGGGWNVGERDLFLLQRYSGSLCVVSDSRGICALPIFTGYHPDLRPSSTHPAGQVAVDIFLSPGRDCCSDEQMRNKLGFAASYAFWFSHDHAIRKLEELAVRGGPETRETACRILEHQGCPCGPDSPKMPGLKK